MFLSIHVLEIFMPTTALALSRELAAFHDFEPTPESFHDAVLRGLSSHKKEISSKFLYDAEGSRLFEMICGVAEYYPTRTETDLLKRHAPEIAKLMGPDCHFIEFGSGASIKARLILEAMERPRSYAPIDISHDHLLESAAVFARLFPHLPVTAVCADYTTTFDFPSMGEGRRVGFFPGSSIGNFTPDEAVAFLNQAASWLDGGGLLIGIDLKKDASILNAAYDDSAGISAAFNLNLLRRINTELDGNFDLACFRHRAAYNHELGRVEMCLVSLRAQAVQVGGQTFGFNEGETIHTENSYKFTVEEFHALAKKAGFRSQKTWIDPANLFSVHYLITS